MLRLLLYLLVALLPFHARAQALAQAQAQAQEGRVAFEQAFAQDSQAEWTVEQLDPGAFQPFQGHVSRGFQSGATWVRLQIAPVAPDKEGRTYPLVLRVGPHYLDRIEVHTQNEGRWHMQLRGALHVRQPGDCPDEMHCFAVQASAQTPATVYLRVQHRGFIAVQVEVLRPQDLPDAVARHVRASTLSLVVAMGLLLMGLAFWVHDRSLLMLTYCGFQASVVVFLSSNLGLVARLFPDWSSTLVSQINYVVYVLRVLMTVVLAGVTLVSHQPGRRFMELFKALLLACGLSMLLALTQYKQLALQLSLLLFTLNPLVMLYGTRVARDLPAAQRKVLTLVLFIYILALALGIWLNFHTKPWLSDLSPIKQVVDMRMNGFAIGFLFFWLALMERSAQNRAKAQEVEALRTRAIQASTWQAQLDERSALIDMLTHELKNPLGTVRFALASLKRAVSGEGDARQRLERIDASVRRMDSLIEHVAYSNKIERTPASQQRETVLAEPLLQELLGDDTEALRWQVEIEDGAAFLCDRQLLVVILENLIGNARKYAPKDQPIDIRVHMQHEADARLSCFEISNPVPPEMVPAQAHLFERYYRHPNVQSLPGMGLGLSLVKTTAQKIEAQVAYRHAQGRVFFTLKVPF